MIEPSLAMQKAVVDRLKTTLYVTSVVPAANIFDRHGLPLVSPCIVIGEDETRREAASYADNTFAVATTLHLWAKSSNMVLVKRMGGVVQMAMRDRFWEVEGHREIYSRLSLCQYLRDPGGEWTHGVLTFESMLMEAAA